MNELSTFIPTDIDREVALRVICVKFNCRVVLFAIVPKELESTIIINN